MAGPRRKAREIALQIVHQMDAGGLDNPELALGRYYAHLSTEGGPAIDEDAPRDEAAGADTAGGRIDRELVESLVRGVAAHRAELDQMLTDLSRNWRLERMAVVERNVIRMALFELRHSPSVPFAVVINEAVELSKRFGTAEGAAFVNGLLERAMTELGLNR